MNKKTIIIIAASIVIVAIVITGTVLIINAVNSQEATKPVVVVPTAATAKALQDKAEEARANNDKTKAKQLLLEAQQQYETVPKTDETTNAQVDIEAQLYLLNQTTKPVPTEPQQ